MEGLLLQFILSLESYEHSLNTSRKRLEEKMPTMMKALFPAFENIARKLVRIAKLNRATHFDLYHKILLPHLLPKEEEEEDC